MQLHGSDSKHVQTVPVHETFQGMTVWQGEVEVFDLVKHPKASQCYAWSENQGKPEEKFTAVLGISPVEDAISAVKASIVNHARRKN